MKNSASKIINYQNAVFVLLKSRFPSLIFGIFIFTYISLFIINIVEITIKRYKINIFSNVITDRKQDKKTVINAIKTYTVKQNDDLWAIAEKMYGSGLNSIDIAKANNLIEPYNLVENQILIIPSVTPKKPTQGEITEEAVETKRVGEYVVLSGEYLWQIAEKIYGDGNQMSQLIDANRIPYPYNVEEGQVLLIP